MSSTTNTEKHVNFLEKLPRELRDNIFTAAVVPSDHMWILTPDPAATLDIPTQSADVQGALNTINALSRVNQQMASESRAIFFSETTFIISSGVRKIVKHLRVVGRTERGYKKHELKKATPRTLPQNLIDNMSNVIIEAPGPRVYRPSDAFVFDFEFSNARATPWHPGSEGGYLLSVTRKAGGDTVHWMARRKEESKVGSVSVSNFNGTIATRVHRMLLANTTPGSQGHMGAKKKELKEKFEEKAPGIVAHIMSKRRWSAITLAEVLRVLGQERVV